MERSSFFGFDLWIPFFISNRCLSNLVANRFNGRSFYIQVRRFDEGRSRYLSDVKDE